MSFFFLIKEILRCEGEEGDKTVSAILCVCHQVQMDLPLLKIYHKVFSVTSESPKETRPKNSGSSQANGLEGSCSCGTVT